MNVDKRGIIVGMAIGDGYVQVRQRLNKGKYAYESRNMRVLHGPKQKAYCEWKADLLGKALGGRNINVTKVKNGPGGKYTAYQFTVSHPYFGQVRKWVYPYGKKRITKKILNMLTPLAIAIWYMDDGSARKYVNSKGLVSSVATDIATMCSEQEVDDIIDFFKTKYDICFKKRYDKRQSDGHNFYIQANTSDSKKFGLLVCNHIPECMSYKINHVALLHSQERQTPVSNCHCGKEIFTNKKGLCTTCYSKDKRQLLNESIGK